MAIAHFEDLRPLRRAEFHQLAELGAFDDERVELIDGVIVRMTPIGPPHSSTVTILNRLLVLAFAGRAEVVPQGAFAASELSEPQPDLYVAPLGDYYTEHPHTAYLVVEVADSSLARDRGRKAHLYAESGIPEYWIVNLIDRRVEVYSEPLDGEYRCISNYERGASIRLVAFPELSFAVADFVR
jgi:Uma2 family endonuclease